ncbi:Aste57867_492 [Aphanomyces stellatus]|uniref:Aste57867_492 protein n=1 Tax=Aphanomyces stellatus TaxID=120398 RepID=A0A485K3Y6_9STRA|nr:hypothetical protein As57867_000491 [Aphanomyces stellatus]VFT77717.1 Aste57867_492 [Aphanomyces stellatus]
MECATPVVPPGGPDDEVERVRRRLVVEAVFMEKVREAESQGLAKKDVELLQTMLLKHVDVFRTDLGGDPPVKVEPLKVRLKPGAVPVKCAMRRYPLPIWTAVPEAPCGAT